nr:MAG TPA: hypothetical protein [Bacteriophage sp.]
MPKSKKPRKKRHYRPAAVYCFKQADIDDVFNRLMRIEFSALLKLGKGESTLDELREMRDFMNAVVLGTVHRNKATSDEESQKSIAFLIETGGKLAKLVNNTPPDKSYVCDADQLKSILSALRTCTTFAEESFKNCPNTFLNEINGSLLIRDAVARTERFTVTKKIADIAVHEAAALSRIKHPELYEKEYGQVIKQIKQLVIDANSLRKN